MDQKTPSSFNSLPLDILGRLFGFLDRLTLIEIMPVNKTWREVAERYLTDDLFEQHYTQAADALKESYLLMALCDWVASHPDDEGDIFSEAQQKVFLQEFKQGLWKITSDGSETPLQFLRRVADLFQKGLKPESYEKNLIVRSDYLARYLKKAPSQINFLFCSAHVQRFSMLYDAKAKKLLSLITDPVDQKFLAQFLAYAQAIESFLTVLIFFEIAHKMPVPRRWEFLRCNYIKHTLKGDGIIALSTQAPYVMPCLLAKYNDPNSTESPLTPDEVQFFFKKLRPADFVAYLNIAGSDLRQAIRHKQPQFVTLLSGGNIENDIAFIHLIKKYPIEEFLEIVETIPEFMSRLKDRLILKGFLNASFISNDKKSLLLEAFLPHFTLPQLSLLCWHIEKGGLSLNNIYFRAELLKKEFTTKLFNEPNDEYLIDAFFSCSFIDSFKKHINLNDFLSRLGRIQGQSMLNYLYQQAVKFSNRVDGSEAENISQKKTVIFFLIRSKVFLQFDDTQLIWLADPRCYIPLEKRDHDDVSFPLLTDFLEPLFSTGRMTKGLFLDLTNAIGSHTLLHDILYAEAIRFGI